MISYALEDLRAGLVKCQRINSHGLDRRGGMTDFGMNVVVARGLGDFRFVLMGR